MYLKGLLIIFITHGFIQPIQAQNQSVISSDSNFFGQSPEIPPPPGTGAGGWEAAYASARALVAQLTIEEKVNLTTGTSAVANGCVGKISPISRVGFPGLCLQDAGNGVRQVDLVSGFPSGLHAGASWNRDLTHQRGIYLGGEFKAKGVNIALGPVVGPLGRIPVGGRNWEGFSNDPYLCGALAGLTVQGIQSNGVMTSTKHFIANEQETNRNPSTNNGTTTQSVSANIDDRTLHELYLWPFAEAVHAGSANIMCSYNRINNSYACQNSKTLNGILKTELGYQGFVVSDWGAQHGGVATAISGLDMVMPSSTFWGPNLTQAVRNGSLPQSRLDDMATRILASWYKMNQNTSIPNPGVGIPSNVLAPHQLVDGRNPASKSTLRQGAVEGHVLVKNINNALPLKTPKLLSVFGYDAKAPDQMDPISRSWTGGDEVIYSCSNSSTNPTCPPLPQIAANGTMISGGGSGAVTPSYIVSPINALTEQAYQDGTQIFWDINSGNTTAGVVPGSDACLVFLNAWASEGNDRPGLHDDFSDALVINTASKCNNTMVIIHNAGGRLVDQWIENPNVTAVIFAHLPGQDSGYALTDILYGKVSPSGKLPYTVARNESQYGALLNPTQPTDAGSQYALFPQSNFSETLYIDYRRFDAMNMTPRFEFGFGLTYTTFSYSNLQIQSIGGNLSVYPSGAIIPGGHADLWDNVATVTAQVTNNGSVSAAEVAQLYVTIPGSGEPVRQLRGFDKQTIAPGQTVTMSFPLMRRDLSFWDTAAQNWAIVKSGQYQISVGASSRILPLTGALSLT